ncbi:tRNA (5-methylaminomethyl-2-thiouridine)(34)-methyltransferase MnmD [Fortiea sp. LEGE XX443]|uniref:tRNA (5-methylaminomethyl-2-thiouridine)(34)-methyltransferase MnmD n=1 Tax=Fortiea sp. LEGE XX443 TaxID=1828611 RepID=UPI00187E1088|nr:MnmC family methyltransferase [Fortiea sp. LEGE XX443]MBE9004613.1 tRNA (5-methylaminomethyl-2-thiouridine)(34)-methyltransferase MnmD [Fortiea sp. LEGE XX443]
MPEFDNFVPQPTADGSFTFFSQEFSESFHSHFGAKQESYFKFVEPTQLAQAALKPFVRLLDICYGLGYNTAAALQTIWAVNPSCHVELIGLELNPAVPQAAIANSLFDHWNYEYTAILTQLAFEQQVQTERLEAKLLIGDARVSIQAVNQSGFLADAIFLDPFSPPQCPHLWTVEFLQQVSVCLQENGLLATYSCAAAVRTALILAGLRIGSTPPVGRRSPGTVAAPNQDTKFSASPPLLIPVSTLLPPLSPAEQEHLLTRAAIPYRDPQLHDSPDVIIMRRQQEQQACLLEPTSRWRKRWLFNTQLRQ